MRHGAEEIGRQFMLSEREIEVLALYMSGLTQKRVAEELSISQTTAHTHIGRIYAKTGLHSRQEILDYVRNHVD
ncbi:helix-turn-helix transcriptional regulator [uncultured Slackia sp.]|uniref:response regulator transcription factor n=1 Tax=uncultured Slackia sp. TaxID=665903 RepID=UPI00280AEBD5|nr:helix-turn-helix transcriptional regulator [uncultured Slackia sp.]